MNARNITIYALLVIADILAICLNRHNPIIFLFLFSLGLILCFAKHIFWSDVSKNLPDKLAREVTISTAIVFVGVVIWVLIYLF